MHAAPGGARRVMRRRGLWRGPAGPRLSVGKPMPRCLQPVLSCLAMHARSLPLQRLTGALRRRSHATWHLAWHGAWQTVRLGALAIALSLSPATYRRPQRTALAVQMVRAALPLLPWFALLAAIVCLVVIRIVLVTAQSYGLSQIALGMLVRVLVLELIPLCAALAVALRVMLPAAAAMPLPRGQDGGVSASAPPLPWLRAVFVPQMLAGAFTVLLLAAVTSLLALVLTYLLAHGFTPFALARFTRLVGQIFDPVVSLVFVLKTGALALAVAVVPLAGALRLAHDGGAARAAWGSMGLFVVVLAIEIAGLAGGYLR